MKETQIESAAQAIRIGLIVAFLIVFVWLTGHVLLELFAGLLFAVLVNGLATKLSRHSRLPYGWAFLSVVATIAAIIAATAYFLAPGVIAQSYQIFHDASIAVGQLSQQISKALPEIKISADSLPSLPQLTSSFVDIGSVLTDAVITGVIILFVGFYAALNPSWYIAGFLRLLPNAARPRAAEILQEIGHSLRWWLFGRAITMISVGLVTLVGLWLLAIPLALTLSFMAGLLTFVPYIGALVSGIPAALIAFVQSPIDAAYVVLVYLGAHILEGYILAPLVQQRTVHLPPALMLSAQILMGTLFGILGAALAAPIVVAVMAIVRVLYRTEDFARDGAPEAPRTSVPILGEP